MSSPRNTRDDFEIVEALFSTERAGGTIIDISKIITDFEIYEHLDKPFLSAKFAIVDTTSFFEDIDFQGGESLSLTIQSSETKSEGFTITKVFAIDKIIKSERADERTEIVYLHGYEDIVLKSSVKNVNKHYSGNPIGIIEKIIYEYLNKNLQYTENLQQQNMELIVPNMHPIEASVWIKNRLTSTDGMPYYLYSTLASDDLYLTDLGTLLLRDPVNTQLPFIYAQSTSQHLEEMHIPIVQYRHENIHDVISLVRKGYVGAEYNFLNTLKGTNEKVSFDVSNDVFYSLAEKNYFNEQNRFIYAPEQGVDGQPLSTYTSKVITQIAGSGAYTYDNYRTNSLNEETEASFYKKRIIGDSLKNFMTKTPISITVPGRPFMRGDGDYTTGNIVRILFLESNHDNSNAPRIDSKKSGNYVMYAAKHNFSTYEPNRIDSTLLCAKLSSYDPDLTAEEFINVS